MADATCKRLDEMRPPFGGRCEGPRPTGPTSFGVQTIDLAQDRTAHLWDGCARGALQDY